MGPNIEDRDSTVNYLLHGSSWIFITKGISLVTGLAANGLLARLIAPDAFGNYVVLATVVAFGSTVFQFGMNQSIVQLVASSMANEKPGQAKKLVQNSFTLAFGASLAILLLLVFGGGQWLVAKIFSIFVPDSLLVILAVWSLILAFQSLSSEGLRGFHDIKGSAIGSGTIGNLLTFLLFAGLFWYGGKYSLLEVISGGLIAEGVGALIVGLMLWKKLAYLPQGTSVRNRQILSASYPQWVTNVALFIAAQVNIWILNAFVPKSDIALYGAASKLIALVATPLLLINPVVAPRIASLYAKKEYDKLRRTIQFGSALAGIPSLILMICLTIFGKGVLGLVFGDYYRQAHVLLAILGLGQIVNVWSGSCGVTLMMTGHQREMMVIALATGFLSATGAYLAVQHFGMVGVAVAAALGMAVNNIIMWLVARQKTGIWTQVSLRYLIHLLQKGFAID